MVFAAVTYTAAIGFFGAIAGVAVENEHADQRVRDVQRHNEQVWDQLNNTGRIINGLELDDVNMIARFHNEAEGRCEVPYEVKGELATVVGELACTKTVPR